MLGLCGAVAGSVGLVAAVGCGSLWAIARCAKDACMVAKVAKTLMAKAKMKRGMGSPSIEGPHCCGPLNNG